MMSKSKNKKPSKSSQKKSSKAQNSAPTKDVEPLVVEPIPKHLHYFLNLMAEARISNYFVVASDTTSIFKTSSELICDCIGSWKTRQPDPGDDTDPTFMEDDVDDLQMSIPDSEKLTRFGHNIVKIGEVLGTLQAEDPIAFCSNIQTDSILGCVIPLAKDVVKLKRKLLRISDTVMPDLKELRRLVEIHGLISTSSTGDTAEVDVTEDFGNYDGSVTDSAMEMLTQRPSVEINPSKGCTRLIHILQNIFATNKATKDNKQKAGGPPPEKTESTHKKKSSKSSSRQRHHQQQSQEMEVKPPSERSSEKLLKKIASTLTPPKKPGGSSAEYILDPVDARVKQQKDVIGGGVGVSPEEEAKLWKRLQEASSLSDIALTSTENSPSAVSGQNGNETLQNSLPERVESPLIVENLTDADVKAILYLEASKCLPRTTTANQESETQTPQNPSIQVIDGLLANSNNANNSEQFAENKLENAKDCEKTLNSIGIWQTLNSSDKLEASASLSEFLLREDKPNHTQFNNSSKTRQILTQYRILVEGMHTTVGSALEKIRQVEQSWMNTATRALGFQNFLKVGDMLDYIRGTILLLNDAQFSEQVYPETRSNVLKALEPVYREFHSCFIVLGELAETVTTDAIYLKELLENLPKGDPIVYEFTSNPSLGSLDQIENAADVPAKSIVFDLEAIFG